MEYNISNSEKAIIPPNPVLKKASSSNKMEENKDTYSPLVKFPAISPKPQNNQKLLVDKSNQIPQIFKKEVSSLENIPNQADLMVSNMKMNPGVKYSDNIGNVKTNENRYNPQIGGSFEKPIRMSRSEYMELVKNQGNYLRKKYVAFEENNANEIKTIKSEIVVKNQEKHKKNMKKQQFDIIDEKSQGMENDNSQQEENNNQNGEVIDRVGTKVYQHNNARREENKGKKKNDNIIINNPIYLKELLLCD